MFSLCNSWKLHKKSIIVIRIEDSIVVIMSNKKKSSKREIRVPAKYGDSVHVLPRRNSETNINTGDSQKQSKGKDRGDNGEGDGIRRAKSSGKDGGFVGDLNGQCFPSLGCQVFSRIRSLVQKPDALQSGVSATDAARTLGIAPAMAKEHLLAAESKGRV